MKYRVGYTLYTPDAQRVSGFRHSDSAIVVEASKPIEALNKALSELNAVFPGGRDGEHALIGSAIEPIGSQ